MEKLRSLMRIFKHLPLLFSLLMGAFLLSLEFIPTVHMVGGPTTKVTYTLEKAETPAIGWWEIRIEGKDCYGDSFMFNHKDVSTFLANDQGIERIDILQHWAAKTGWFVPDAVSSQFNSSYHFWVVQYLGVSSYGIENSYRISLYLTYRLKKEEVVLLTPIASTLGSNARQANPSLYVLAILLIAGSFCYWFITEIAGVRMRLASILGFGRWLLVAIALWFGTWGLMFFLGISGVSNFAVIMVALASIYVFGAIIVIALGHARPSIHEEVK